MSVIELPPDDSLSSVVWEVCRNHGAKNGADHVQRAGDGYSENLHVIPGQFFVLLMSEADRINYETGGKNMEKWLYVMMIKRGKSYNRVTKAVITRHVENLRNLDAEGKIELCGPLKGYPGVAGMVIFKTQSREEAEALCRLEPPVAEGYATCTLAALQVADKENNYLL